MRRLTLIALAIGATAIVAACGSSNSKELTGKLWQLTSITEKVPAFQGVIPPADQTKYQIKFNSDNTFNATADCNLVGGTYKTSGKDQIEITPGHGDARTLPRGLVRRPVHPRADQGRRPTRSRTTCSRSRSGMGAR